jgi:hypothetical protein
MRRHSDNERRLRALGDRALVDAMRAGDDFAFGEFLARFRPLLLAYADGRIPSELFPECVDEVLEDAALRLSEADAKVPAQLAAYLVGAVRKRYLAVKRSGARRQRRYEDAAVGSVSHTSDGASPVVVSACAESTIAASRGTYGEESTPPSALQQLASVLDVELDDESRRILDWLARATPHRQIAEWLDKSYDATTKQIWRLCRRLERAAPSCAATLSPEAQRELDRFFRRAKRGRRGV